MPEAPHGPRLDKRGLLQAANEYLEAVLQNTTSRLSVAPDIRVTDNGQVVQLGHGNLWGKAVRFQGRQTWADADTQSVVFFGTAADSTSSTWWWYEARLTFRNRRLAEVEELDWQAPSSGFGSTASAQHEGDPLYDSIVPREDRTSARDMLAAVNAYWDALGSTDAQGRGWTVPFSPDCQRLEMGFYTSNQGPNSSCVTSFLDPTWRWTIDNRRFYIVDEVRGVVVGIGMFHGARSFPVPEAFKIENGLIRKMVANFNVSGLVTQSGWPDL
jgi:hypothetical protein